ncbi:MAG: AAA-like domain-containing protein [Desulfobacterales bacterium]|nr:AAA-like domain-containing protein [Desulfobacterales bacterium]
MRRFSSYGPVDSSENFCIKRAELVQRCTSQMIGNIDKKGHYFTIWAPRQAGKTWIMRKVKEEIELKHSDKFVVGTMSMQGIVIKKDEREETLLNKIPQLIWETFKYEISILKEWEDFKNLFSIQKGIFNRPVLLFIDEFDSLPPAIIDILITLFRDMFLKRDSYLLHGLALIGVRAVLGVESYRGSPFNIQRSLHIPNFTKEEVIDLYQQYQDESGQKIADEVVEKIFEFTRGQPGLVNWFGELLTEKYNHEPDKSIDMNSWKKVCSDAVNIEWNNTILNLIKKARGNYQDYVVDLFSRPDMLFMIDADWCSYLYLNGIIDYKVQTRPSGENEAICIFSSPFVQRRLYNALTIDVIGDRMPIPSLDALDTLADVFENQEINTLALLERYKNYLKRLKAKGINPWKEQPRRADLHLTEAVGHFHIYAWLQSAIGRKCVISPEFPTGNGRVDLHLSCMNKKGLIEVKSFTNASEIKENIMQAAGYAQKTGLNSITIALFVPFDDESILEKLSAHDIIDDIKVNVFAIGWQ